MKEIEAFAQRLMQNLYRMARCRHAVFQDILSEYGVTLHQFHLLMHIKMSGEVKISDLSDLMLVSMPTASRMINTVSEMGLVTKKKISGDKRLTYLELTAEGDKMVDELRKRQLETIARILEKIPQDDLEVFLRATERMADEMVSGLNRE
jgi:DNA-binding MarR family transcriptional regulator